MWQNNHSELKRGYKKSPIVSEGAVKTDAEQAKPSGSVALGLYIHKGRFLFKVFRQSGRLRQNEGIFCENKFVGVGCYGRVCFRKKQVMVRILEKAAPFSSF